MGLIYELVKLSMFKTLFNNLLNGGNKKNKI